MARKGRTSASPLTPQVWSKKFFEYALEANFFGRSGLIGNDPSACIQVNTDLKKTAGDTVRFMMNAPLVGVGGGDDFKMTDVLESYASFYFDLTIHERGNATGIAGPMTQQRMIEDWPEIAVKQLAGWKGITMEKEIIKALSGLYNLSTSVESVNENAPTPSRIAYGGETSAGVVDTLSALGDDTALGAYSTGTKLTSDALLSADTVTDCLMGPNFLERVVLNFMNSEPRPQLLTIEGRPCLILLMSPWQAHDMKKNTTYVNRNMYAEVRGSNNPLLSDSLGFWNCGEVSVLLKPYGRIEQRTGAGGTTPAEGFTLNSGRTATSDVVVSGVTVARALLLGAQAGAIGYGGKNGKTFNRRKGDEDGGSGRKPFYGVDWIYGVSKTIFSNEAATAQQDFATMCIDTCVVL